MKVHDCLNKGVKAEYRKGTINDFLSKGVRAEYKKEENNSKKLAIKKKLGNSIKNQILGFKSQSHQNFVALN